jgi:hypothetical protein
MNQHPKATQEQHETVTHHTLTTLSELPIQDLSHWEHISYQLHCYKTQTNK